MASQAVKIIDGGKLIIPAAFRRKLGIDTGDTVVLELGEDGLHVRSLTSAVRLAQEIVREFVPNEVNLADELVAERRSEAERE
ncbi:AbrB/MazE/SpoVT family DNA-binding domain-containing protein [Methylobacterium sp. WL30]|uniref:AbrB/MazE/SpoVT family DNA-binding domain-containing protein n=1 Tax=unclassified Methylobacterium TaxID=2615210 RepID=UPI0011CA09AA|nr:MULTISPECIES: AbrB/MazE/SpoVT family DNA-binding domain-containing protein [unclassified Methylobacterium]TXM94896.1 AbrB/MazE/SpoVT family DNA-binding domain-containing protein [Methylobacterium sp. WL116]TXN19740.1 AbrB/MazE/SpoVT family DNA-binding domain-containing protein [Methylobacterium sp. WL93]TXN42944.1 AbrB/MazE/SpoVT family DNA-binding domain-containing protein [Methylobacterium sp. WL119]TXN61516.1 AbrB/MazE/SpoVT family DNA-binding domain-containing protein [Methylobacterium s